MGELFLYQVNRGSFRANLSRVYIVESLKIVYIVIVTDFFTWKDHDNFTRVIQNQFLTFGDGFEDTVDFVKLRTMLLIMKTFSLME